MLLASRNPFSNRLLLIRHFFCKPYWATAFKMHFGFHPLFRETFAKIPLSADPSHQQGAHERKSKHQGPWCLALAKPRFGKLGCCIWSLFLKSKATLGSTSDRCKHVLQDHGIWLLGCYLAVPFSCRTPGRQEVVALNKL